MHSFEMKMLPWNVVFGVGEIARLAERLESLGLSRALVLSTPEQRGDAERIGDLLGARCAGLYDQARMHVPTAIAQAAAARARELACDCTVSIGGGSTTGLGKAIALECDLPLVAIPTTYAGSEMTCIWGMTEQGRKRTGRDLRVLPKLTIYDPELTIGLPPAIAGPSGMNALAQATINAMDERTNPVIRSMALEAIRAIKKGLPTVMETPNDLEARGDLLFGASLAGAALGAGVTSLHHRLCHTLGGTYDTAHAETHTVLLPYSVAHAAPAVPGLVARIADALGADSAAGGIHDLSSSLGLPTRLAELGVDDSEIDRIADIALETDVVNPQPVTRAGVIELLRAAATGKRPT